MVGGSKTLYEEIYGEPLPDQFIYLYRSVGVREKIALKGEIPIKSIFMLRGSGSLAKPVFGGASLDIGSVQAYFLEKHFRNPFRPTEEERVLFEIGFGVEYPLKTDKAPLQVDNAQLKADKIN